LKPVAAWARPFDDPILLDGRELLTLRDAADFIMKLPKAEQDLEEWQTATGCLIGAAEGGDFVMHAHIGVLRALNRNKRKCSGSRGTSDLPSGADIVSLPRHVRLVPMDETARAVERRGWRHSQHDSAAGRRVLG
jgi:hypothetical protein